MPQVNGGGGDDSNVDEVKVFKDEGDEVDEKCNSECLRDDKSELTKHSEEVSICEMCSMCRQASCKVLSSHP